MKKVIPSARFGPLEYTTEQVITFPKGLPGFDSFRQYLLFPLDQAEEAPFYILHSVEDEDLAFIVLDTLRFFPDYEVQLGEEIMTQLQIETPDEVLILTTVTVQDEWKRATTNLKAPLVINTVKRLGQQMVIEERDYLIKQPLFAGEEEPSRTGQEG